MINLHESMRPGRDRTRDPRIHTAFTVKQLSPLPQQDDGHQEPQHKKQTQNKITHTMGATANIDKQQQFSNPCVDPESYVRGIRSKVLTTSVAVSIPKKTYIVPSK